MQTPVSALLAAMPFVHQPDRSLLSMIYVCHHVRVAPTAQDYAWIHDQARGLIKGGYTLTFIEGLAPIEVLDGFGADPRLSISGLDGLGKPAWTAGRISQAHESSSP